MQHPAVIECAVVGANDDNGGVTVKQFVVVNNPSVAEEELRVYCRKNLTGYKIPKLIEFRDDLPKSSVGKILRRELRRS